jgi:hypothetical protein
MNHRPIRSPLITSGLIVASLATVFVSGAAQAALQGRDLNGSAGSFEAYYDTDLDITWLADANYAQTSGYDADGRMTWAAANTWAANLSYYNPLTNQTYADWRLPTTTDTGTTGCDFAYSGTDCGYNVDPASSEMAHLYFVTLGNQSYRTTTGLVGDAYAGGANSFSTLDNVGPFINFQSYLYWSGTEYAPDTTAWSFGTKFGDQGYYDLLNFNNSSSFYALAVSPGDVGAVPEAETYALMLAGLGLIGWRARRRG